MRPAPDRTEADARAHEVPRWARRFVAGFLGAFVLAGVLGVEAWPLTGWRLFSTLRTDRQVAWAAVAVDSRGVERPLPFARLPTAYGNFALIARGFDDLTDRERGGVCRAWLEAARSTERDITEVRVYRLERRLWPRTGGRATLPPIRRPDHRCEGGPAAAGA